MFRLISCLLAPGLLWAADPVPTAPLIAAAPATAGWTVSVTYKLAQPEPIDKQSSAHANWKQLQEIVPAIKEIRVGKSGDRRREVIYYVQGKQDERLVVGKREFLRRAAFAPGDVFVSDSSVAADFPEVGWVALDNYVGVQTYAGRQCFYYTKNVPGNEPLQAWVEVTSRLPLRVDDGMYDRVYEYSAAPAVAMEPSTEIAKKLREMSR